MFYVYKITNLVNGKIYIGKTDDLDSRWEEHIKLSNRPNDKCYSLIHKAIAKYGETNFSIEIVESLDLETEALGREKYWIYFHQSNVSKYANSNGYNLTDGGEGVSGFRFSDKQKKEMSESRLGKANSFYGKTHTEKTRKVIAKQLVSYFKQYPNPNIGKEFSSESRKRMSESHVGVQAGEKHPLARLTEEDIHSIFQMIILGHKDEDIASLFNVVRKSISNIRLGKSWKHIPRPPELTGKLH